MGSAAREVPKCLGEKLRHIRLVLRKTQLEMRALLKLDEFHISYLSIWETGRREPPLSVLLKYARLVGLPTDVFIDDDINLPDDQVLLKYARRLGLIDDDIDLPDN